MYWRNWSFYTTSPEAQVTMVVFVRAETPIYQGQTCQGHQKNTTGDSSKNKCHHCHYRQPGGQPQGQQGR